MNTYILASRVIDGIEYTIERLDPRNREGQYRLREGESSDDTYTIVDEADVEERLIAFFGTGHMQAKSAIRRAKQWAKQVQYEFFPSSPDASSA